MTMSFSMNALCGTCGEALAPEAALYDERGNVICNRCLLEAQATQSRSNVARRVVKVAYGGPGLGLLSFVFNPLGLLSLAAVGNGLYVLRELKQSQNAALVGSATEKAKVAAIAGIVLGAITGVLTVVSFLT